LAGLAVIILPRYTSAVGAVVVVNEKPVVALRAFVTSGAELAVEPARR
jgi:hypothetical protein